MFCTQCGQQVSDHDNFCTHCGAKLAKPVLPAPVQSFAPEPVIAPPIAAPTKKVIPLIPSASKFYGTPIKRKLTSADLQSIQTKLGQLQDSAVLLNTTVKPDVFFKRLNFTIDLLLDLQCYERHKIFTSLPSRDVQKILDNLEATVDDFIDRAVAANNQKVASLKTEKARIRNRKDFAIKLIAAFDCAHTFWSGNFSKSRVYPHYTGPLFTQNNYRRVLDFYNSLDCLDT